MTQTWRIGTQNERRSGAKRPSLKGMLTERRGRDVGFAKSGFRHYGLSRPLHYQQNLTRRFPALNRSATASSLF